MLVVGEKMISEDKAVADTMNTFFAHAVEELNIIGYQVENQTSLQLDDSVLNAINKFKDHPSILKIKENVKVGERFTFLEKHVDEIKTEIECLNTHKPTPYNNIPAKVLVNCEDISAGYITTAYNVNILHHLDQKLPLPIEMVYNLVVGCSSHQALTFLLYEYVKPRTSFVVHG